MQTHFTHGTGKYYVAGCPDCQAIARARTTGSAGKVRDRGRVVAMREWTDEQRLEHTRRQTREGSARHRAKHGRHPDHRYPGKNAPKLRDHWVARGIDPDQCFYCAAPAEHADHFYPRARGGSDEYTNLVPACAPCNHRKNDMLPVDWINQLLAA